MSRGSLPSDAAATSGTQPATGSTVVNHAAPQVERFIDRQLRATRSRVKLIDFAGGSLLAVVSSLGFIFLFVLADHWLVTGGLSSRVRLVSFGLLAVMWLYYLARHILPSIWGRVNPLYAAEQLERGRPTLKNSLINFLQLRTQSSQLNPAIYSAIEHRAATDLSAIEIENTVDRSRLVKLGYLLAFFVTLGAVYKVMSPKDPLRSIGRVIAPWANIAVPTRVRIADITPGDSQEFIDRRVNVTCRITGLWNNEPVTLVYSTADGQEVNRRLSMRRAEQGSLYSVDLPDTSGGLQQDLVYEIDAGDAHTRSFELTVVSVPTIAIDRVKYRYPAYTQLGERTIERQGDLRAIEGTFVTVEASANNKIASASLDFERDGAGLIPMSVNERRASVEVALRMQPVKNDPTKIEPEHRNYQLLFRTPTGATNPNPIEHKIDIIADEKPRVQIIEPRVSTAAGAPSTTKKAAEGPAARVVELPLGRALRLVASAQDPDFRLGTFTWIVNKEKLSLTKAPLLLYDPKAPEEKRPASFDGAWIFDSAKFKQLKVGDTLEAFVEATDNKQPKPNLAQSERVQIKIVDPNAAPPQQDQLAQNDPRQKPGDPDNKPDPLKTPPQGEQGKAGDKSDPLQITSKTADDKNDSGKPSDKPNGDGSQKNSEQKQGDSKQSGSKPGDQQKGDQGGGDSKGGQGKQGDSKQGDSKQGGESPGQQSGEQQPGAKPSEGNQQSSGGSQQPNQPAGEQNSTGGNRAQGDSKTGQPNAGQQSPGDAGKGNEPPQRVDPQNDPGKAIDEINKFFGDDKQLAQNDPSKSKSPAGSEGGKSQPGGKNEPGKNDSGKNGTGDKTKSDTQPKADAQPKGGDPSKSGEKAPNAGETKADGGEKSDKPDAKAGQEKGAGDNPSKNDSRPTDKPNTPPQQGQGGESATPPAGEKPSQPMGDSKQSENNGGDPSQKGNAGAGQSNEQQSGSTSPQESSKPRDKSSPQTPNAGDKKGDEAGSPSRSKSESDAQGDSSGDQSGGGKQGGGQRSNQAGTGAAGTNTAAEQGGSQTAGKGDGPTGNKGGDQAKSDQQTGGKSSGEKGNGSQQQSGGEKSGGDSSGAGKESGKGPAGDGQSNQANNPKQNDKQSRSENPGGSQSSGTSGDPIGGGTPGERTIPSEQLAGADRAGDDPNLDYARKATELAVQRLKDQLAKGEPDPELLKKLQWTKEDAQQFVQRWQEMMRQSQQPDAQGSEARRELDETLRSLGLRPRGTNLAADRKAGDQQRGLKETQRSAPPAEYADQFKAFTRGTGKKTE